MITTDDLKSFKKLVEDFKPEPGFFEKQIFIPQMHGRLGYIKDIFAGFCQIANQDEVAEMIDAAVRKVVFPTPVPGTPEPEVGRQYLQQVREMMQTSFIEPINQLQNRYTLDSLVGGNIERMTSFLNESKIVFDSVAAVRTSMFEYIFRGIVTIRDRATGEVQYAPTKEVNIIMAPFEIRMGELINVATTASDSIKMWTEALKTQANKHVEVVVNVSQVRAAHEQTVAARWYIGFQVAVILFAIIGVILSQPVSTFVEKRFLESAYQDRLSEIQSCQSQAQTARSEAERALSKSVNDLNSCRTQLSNEKPGQ